jgi:hypothetical protein
MKRLAMLFSLLIPFAFAGGYILATANARVTCIHGIEAEAPAVHPVCADITTQGVTALFFLIVGVVLWAVIWFAFTRRRPSSS